MATWYDPASMALLLNNIKTTATTVHLLDTYSTADNYSTVSGNSIGNAAITDTDFTGSQANGDNQELIFNGKGGTATSNSTVKNLHIAITSGSVVLAVTDETSDQDITNGNPITFPAFTMTAQQPTQV